MENKKKRINMLLIEIKQKIEYINKLNDGLKETNYKLEALITAINKYSCFKNNNFDGFNLDSSFTMLLELRDGEGAKKMYTQDGVSIYDGKFTPNRNVGNTIGNISNNTTILNQSNTLLTSKVNTSINYISAQTNTTNPSININAQQFKPPKSLNEIWSSIQQILPNNLLYRTNTEKIIKTLYKHKNGLLLDDIIKLSGVPKYRCIDILNFLIKTSQPWIFKKFEKGFVYKLNN
ncbi:hypothetical protein TCON_1008 [Astathelohania contejeani]|uniref:Uncharacterized protein n=1 Tax=Astathelohania contejeani TaxID=164912 RepID=A0ABQ7I0A9_9MICR|nr:hypothetical protein TCON_1008 [Thelohania contejeani]